MSASSAKAGSGGEVLPASRRLARWIAECGAQTPSEEATGRAKGVLLDSLGCAVAAHREDTATAVVRLATEAGGRGEATIIGTKTRVPLTAAGFANVALIRALDLNDAYSGPGLVGHPSDNLGYALSVCEFMRRPASDLLRAIRLSYEVYGRILDHMDPKETPWDHTSASGLATAAASSWLLRLDEERTSHALALIASHAYVSREVRGAHVSAGKSLASAVVAQTACMLTLLEQQGVTGPGEPIEGSRGFLRTMFGSGNVEALFAPALRDRLLSSSIKLYPCFAIGQAPINAALELRGKLEGQLADVESFELALADTVPAKLRLKDVGHLPRSREAADHSLQFVVAVALADGEFGLKQFDSERWTDSIVCDLMERIQPAIDATLPTEPPGVFPCRLTALKNDGTRVSVERMSTPGHASRPLTFDEVREKFRPSGWSAGARMRSLTSSLPSTSMRMWVTYSH